MPAFSTVDELEQRLIAPCCWTQTLDAHDSEIVRAMRLEIRERLARGDSSQVIEDDFAARYGERVRAVPRGRDPRVGVPAFIGLGMAGTLALLFAVVARRAKLARTAEPGAPPETDTRYDHALSEELRRFDR